MRPKEGPTLKNRKRSGRMIKPSDFQPHEDPSQELKKREEIDIYE